MMAQPSPEDLEKACQQLQHLLGTRHGWQAAYLSEQVLFLPELASSFKSTRPAIRTSELSRKLHQVTKNPIPMIRALIGPGVTRKEAWRCIETNAIAVILLYYHARITWGSRAERRLGRNGTALDHLRKRADPAGALKAAAQIALQNFDPGRPRGRGGIRRRRDTALDLAAEHVLDVYTTITREAPSVSVLTRSKNPSVQIKGKAVQFLEICLKIMGLQTSRATLRRCIESYRRKMQPKRPKAKEIAAPQTMRQ